MNSQPLPLPNSTHQSTSLISRSNFTNNHEGLPVIKFKLPVTKTLSNSKGVHCAPHPVGSLTDPKAALDNHFAVNTADQQISPVCLEAPLGLDETPLQKISYQMDRIHHPFSGWHAQPQRTQFENRRNPLLPFKGCSLQHRKNPWKVVERVLHSIPKASHPCTGSFPPTSPRNSGFTLMLHLTTCSIATFLLVRHRSYFQGFKASP